MAKKGRTFTVHREPKGKQRVRVTRSGHAYTPYDTTTYEGMVRAEYVQQVGDVEPFLGPVDVSMTAFFEVPKSWSKRKHLEAIYDKIRPTKVPDCDNIAKMICDALNGLAYKDDAQVVNLYVKKVYSDELPHVTVTIVGLEE